MHRQFTSADVHYIRTSGISDAEMGRILKVTAESVRRVRVGIHYQDHPTPPDTAPRLSKRGGRVNYFALADDEVAKVTAAMNAWARKPILNAQGEANGSVARVVERELQRSKETDLYLPHAD